MWLETKKYITFLYNIFQEGSPAIEKLFVGDYIQSIHGRGTLDMPRGEALKIIVRETERDGGLGGLVMIIENTTLLDLNF